MSLSSLREFVWVSLGSMYFAIIRDLSIFLLHSFLLSLSDQSVLIFSAEKASPHQSHRDPAATQARAAWLQSWFHLPLGS